MASSRDRRLAKELADMQEDKEKSGVYAEPKDGDNLANLTGKFPAPPDTPYAGGTYEVDIVIPDQYPFKPPKMNIVNKIWHPNISSQTGAICLDTLTTAWSPVQTIKTVLLSLRMLLECPNPKDPQDYEVARMLIEHPTEYASKAQEWAVKYAGAPKQNKVNLEKFTKEPSAQETVANKYGGFPRPMIDRFVNMGFDIERVVEAFSYYQINANNGQDYELEEAYMGDITARLLGES